MKICPKCNQPVPDSVNFCPNCGTQATEAPAPKTTGKLLYTATRSIWYYKGTCALGVVVAVLGIVLTILLASMGPAAYIFLLGIPVGALFFLFAALFAHAYRIQIYDDHIIVHEGLLNVREKRSLLTPIVGASIHQTLWGKLFNYGDVQIDKQGKGWDVSTVCIRRPKAFKNFVESLMSSADPSSFRYVLNN